MNIRISTTYDSEKQEIRGRNNEVLYYEYDLNLVDYFFETEHYVFFADTNLSKEKEAYLQVQLSNLLQIEEQEIARIFNENYFVVVLDKVINAVHVMRDVCGVKTGYWSKEGDDLLIGSVMHDVAQAKNTVSYHKEAVGQLLYSGYLLDGYTLYEEVEEVKMGTTLIFNFYLQLEEVLKTKIDMAESDNQLSAEENFKQLRKEIQEAHRGYLGLQNRVFLSGGLDSIAMLIALDDMEVCQNFDSISFRVKGTTQDETVYAKSIADHLKIKNTLQEIDAEDTKNVENFEETILSMNNPYFGTWIFGNFDGNPGQMYYAGQDSRLHTPALNEIDKWAFKMIRIQNSWILKKVALPLSKLARRFMEKIGWQKGETMLQRNLYKAAFIFDLEKYVKKFYLKLDKEKIAKKGLPTDYYEQFTRHFDFDLQKIKTPRALYNKLVALKWKEQYIYDMRYLQDVARNNNTYIAMPFYRKQLAEFSSSIPFDLATKPMFGRARFGKKRHIIYKYVLRHAFRDKLNDLTFYRAKAVSQTLHQLFNGALGKKVRELLQGDLLEKNSFIRQFGLENYVTKFLDKETFGLDDDDLMATVYYIATLTVYHKNVMLKPKKQEVKSKKNDAKEAILFA